MEFFMEIAILFGVSFLWWYFLNATVITSGYHRYFAHNSFKAPVWYEYMVLYFGAMCGLGHLIGWAGVHRMHHRYSDTEDDPHSPAHVGYWKIITSSYRVKSLPRRHIKDLLRNKRVMWFYRYHKHIRAATLIIPLLISPKFWFFFIIMPVIWAHIANGTLNMICHWKGNISNSWIVNFLIPGEGWHANHHKDTANWRIGREWWQWDPGSWWIKLIKQ